jgi:hypothetical protein
LEKVVLVVARGTGGCDAFSMHYVEDSEDLTNLHAFDNYSVTPDAEGKWTDLWLPLGQRRLFRRIRDEHCTELQSYGAPELGTVTGANHYFTLDEPTRAAYSLVEGEHVVPVSPPGTKHLRGLSFTVRDWEALRDARQAVWLFRPVPSAKGEGLNRYLARGIDEGVHKAYKCRVRETWYRPPAVLPPDVFFTYMSHWYPRLIHNKAGVTFVNSMHGLRLGEDAPKVAAEALPLLVLNSVTMLGAEVYGRSYGGGVLKMEPREAALLPVPRPELLEAAWARLRKDKASFDRELRAGRWTNVVKRVDDVLLREVADLPAEEVVELHRAATTLRARRLGT